jgi:hypothetical protein
MKKGLTLRRKLRYTFMFISMCTACPPLACETRYVLKNGGNTPPYTTPETAASTIQAALDVARLGDVVVVGQGDYEESITLRPEGLTLIGAGRDRCRILVPHVEGSIGIVAESRVLELRGFAVLGGEVGISVLPTSAQVLIAECTLEGAAKIGLLVREWSWANVLDTVFRSVPEGIHMQCGDTVYAGVDLFVSGCEFVGTDTGIHGGCLCMVAATESVFVGNGTGIYGGWGALTLVDSCKFLDGSYGVVMMTADGTLQVSNSVFALNSSKALETDQSGLVSDSLFYANGHACDEWDGGDQPAFVRCTFVSNQVALGRMPQTARDCIFWNNGKDISWDEYSDQWPDTRIFDHCLINHPAFAGKNGNISGDPELVECWAAFNDSDNPVHVDSSALRVGDGSAERPFGSLQEALSSFELRLGEGSICVGAGALGGDIGYRAGTVPHVVEGSNRVAVEMAPGAYEVLQLPIPGSVTLRGEPGGSQRPSIRVLLGDVWEGSPAAEEGARLSGLDFHDSELTALGAELSDCRFYGGGVGLNGSSAIGCQFFLAAGLGLGDTPCRISNCLIVGSTLPLLRAALDILSAEEPHQLINCTIIDEDMAIRLYWDEPRLFARLANCIVSGPVSDSPERLQTDHCLFTDGWPGEGNIAGDPMFVDAENGDYRLRAESPCVDSGSLRAVLRPEVSVDGQEARLSWSAGEDLSANPRISGDGVDMGAYEYQSVPGKFVLECSDDLAVWQELGTSTGFEWLDRIRDTKQRFYRLGLSP